MLYCEKKIVLNYLEIFASAPKSVKMSGSLAFGGVVVRDTVVTLGHPSNRTISALFQEGEAS